MKCIRSDKFLLVLLTHEVTFWIHWNNIEGSTSPAWCQLQRQWIYKQSVSQADFVVAHRTIHSNIVGRPGDLKVAFGDRICSALNNSNIQLD